MRRERRGAILPKVERYTEPVLLLMAFAMVPILIGPWLWDLSTAEVFAFASIGTLIWIAFAADLAVKVLLAPDRVEYVRRHLIDVVIVLVPFFRPVRLLVFGTRAITGMRKLAEIDFAVVLTAGLVILGATAMHSVEGGVNESLGNFGDTLWWGLVTVTTVGYGDIVPATTLGRIVALFLMLGGIALFGAVAGNVAAFLSRTRRRSNSGAADAPIAEEVRALREAIAQLRASIDRLAGPS